MMMMMMILLPSNGCSFGTISTASRIFNKQKPKEPKEHLLPPTKKRNLSGLCFCIFFSGGMNDLHPEN